VELYLRFSPYPFMARRDNFAIYTEIVPTNAAKTIEISLYTRWTATCFGQPCDLRQAFKIQRLGTLTI